MKVPGRLCAPRVLLVLALLASIGSNACARVGFDDSRNFDLGDAAGDFTAGDSVANGSPIVVSPADVSPPPGGTVLFCADGGAPPYSFAIVGGGGTLIPRVVEDSSFGAGGRVTTDTGSSVADTANAVAVQNDGLIVVGGASGVAFHFAVARYLSSGALDASFGILGIATPILFGTNPDRIEDIAVDTNGSITAIGYHQGVNSDFVLARFDSVGNLDSSFGTGGKQTTADLTGGVEVAYAMATQDDGSMVLVGHADNNFALARYLPNGTLDVSFSTDGKVVSAFAGAMTGRALAVVLQPDGKIIIAGYADVSSVTLAKAFALARYDSAGNSDTSFGTGGLALVDLGGQDDIATTLSLLPGGKILVAGTDAVPGAGIDIAVARLDSLGQLDTSFGVAGVSSIDMGSVSDSVVDMALQADGKIILFGGKSNGSDMDFLIMRLDTNGALDGTFNPGGSLVTDFGAGDDFAQAMAVQADGRIVAVGSAFNGTDRDIAIVRYNPNCAEFTAPGTPGTTTISISDHDGNVAQVQATIGSSG